MSRFSVWIFILALCATSAGLWVGYKGFWGIGGPSKTQNALSILVPTHVFSPEWIQDFQRRHQIILHVDEAAAPESLLEKFEARPNKYDVLFFYTHQLASPTAQARLQNLDRAQLKNVPLISPDFWDLPGDISAQNILPVFWGLSGFAFDTQKIKEPIDAWTHVWAQSRSTLYLNSSLDIYYLLTLRNGSSTTLAAPEDSEVLRKPLQDLLSTGRLGSAWRAAHSPVEGSAVIQMHHSDFIAFDKQKSQTWKFVLPKEKALLWVMGAGLATHSTRSALAYRFFDILLQKEEALRLSENNSLASVNRALEETVLDARLKPSYIRTIPLDRFRVIPIFEFAGLMRKAINSLSSTQSDTR